MVETTQQNTNAADKVPGFSQLDNKTMPALGEAADRGARAIGQGLGYAGAAAAHSASETLDAVRRTAGEIFAKNQDGLLRERELAAIRREAGIGIQADKNRGFFGRAVRDSAVFATGLTPLFAVGAGVAAVAMGVATGGLGFAALAGLGASGLAIGATTGATAGVAAGVGKGITRAVQTNSRDGKLENLLQKAASIGAGCKNEKELKEEMALLMEKNSGAIRDFDRHSSMAATGGFAAGWAFGAHRGSNLFGKLMYAVGGAIGIVKAESMQTKDGKLEQALMQAATRGYEKIHGKIPSQQTTEQQQSQQQEQTQQTGQAASETRAQSEAEVHNADAYDNMAKVAQEAKANAADVNVDAYDNMSKVAQEAAAKKATPVVEAAPTTISEEVGEQAKAAVVTPTTTTQAKETTAEKVEVVNGVTVRDKRNQSDTMEEARAYLKGLNQSKTEAKVETPIVPEGEAAQVAEAPTTPVAEPSIVGVSKTEMNMTADQLREKYAAEAAELDAMRDGTLKVPNVNKLEQLKALEGLEAQMKEHVGFGGVENTTDIGGPSVTASPTPSTAKVPVKVGK